MSYRILSISEHAFVDNSISDNAYHSHPPYANTSLNKSDEIRLPIQTQDLYTLPFQSFLSISGKVTDEKTNTVSKRIKFICNGVMFMFESIRLEMIGVKIDGIRNPGITTTMKAYTSFTDRDCVRHGNACWNQLNEPNIINSDGYFNVCIPLKMFLGFAEDYKKIILNMGLELVLLRSSTDLNAVIVSQAVGEPDIIPKIELQKIVWKMPHLQVSDVEKLQLMNVINDGINLEIPFRSWELHEYPVLPTTNIHTWNIKASNQLEKPRYVIFGLQTGRKNNMKKNMSHFDHCNLSNIKLYLNSNVYPYDNLNLNFKKNQWAILYEMYARFQQSYYQKESSEPCLSINEFLTKAPLVVIDCSQQNETLKSGSVDIRLEFETTENVPADTSAYCLIINDQIVIYNPQRNIVYKK